MSRLIIKGLPAKLKEERLRKLFGEKGMITDCSMKYTKDGHFRRFAFIGYKTEKEAQDALQSFNKTYIDTTRIQVELARDFGDDSKPRAWSKYSKESSAGKKLEAERNKVNEIKLDKDKDRKKKEKQKQKEAVVTELLGELKDDAGFQEFLDAHQNVTTKAMWTNDTLKVSRTEKSRRLDDSDDDSDDSEDDDDNDGDKGGKSPSKGEAEIESKEKKTVQKTEISDLDYLKSKVGNRAFLSDTSSNEESDDESSDDGQHKSKKSKHKKKNKEKGKSSSKESDGESSDDGKHNSKKKKSKKKDKKKEKDSIEESDDESSDDDEHRSKKKKHKKKKEKSSREESGDKSSDVDEHKSKKNKHKKKKDKKVKSSIEGSGDESSDDDEHRSKKNKHNKKKKEKGSSEESEGEYSEDNEHRSKKNKHKKKDKKKEKSSDKEKGKKEKAGEKYAESTQEKDVNIVFMTEMKGLPANISEKSIKEFFLPLNIAKIRIIKNAKQKPLGTAYVGFNSEKDLETAIRRNKNFINGKKIFVRRTETEPLDEEVYGANPKRPWELKKQDDDEEGIADTGRLFVRNLPYSCTEEDLEEKFKKYGPLTEVSLPIDSLTKKLKGFAFVTYMIPEHAVKAFSELDGIIFQGRMLHILPGKEKKDPTDEILEGSSFKRQKQAKQKAQATSSHNWNSLFLGANAVADVLAEKYEAEKSKILDLDLRGSLGVRMALGETQVVTETRKFLTSNGVSLDSFSQANAPRSKTIMLVKNLPARTKTEELQEVFSKHGTLGRVLMPPTGVTAIVEYLTPTEAKTGFTRLAYTKFHNVPLFLEWAPMEVFKEAAEMETDQKDTADDATVKQKDTDKESQQTEESDDETAPGSTLFVKNLNFSTTDESLREEFESCGKVKKATVARKKDVKNPGSTLSLGYGFVEFASLDGAKKALKQLQHTLLDGHQLELKVSNRTTVQPQTAGRKKQKTVEQTSTKILVRNIPFEARNHELEELFKVFGELKSVRLPKKLGGTGTHRGFGFVDFLTKQDAKRAFEALCHSTHLYGRRLVLEWAEMAEDLEDVRKRTAEHFHDDDGRYKKLTKASLTDHLETSHYHFD